MVRLDRRLSHQIFLLVLLSQKFTKTNSPLPGWSYPWTDPRPWHLAKWHQEMLCPSYIGGRLWAHGRTLQKYCRWYDLLLGGILYNSLCTTPPKVFLETRPFLALPLSHWEFFKNVPSLKPSATQQPDIPATPTKWAYIHGTSDRNIMGLGWATNKHLGSGRLESEVLVVQLGQTSEPVGTRIIPAVAASNQPGP